MTGRLDRRALFAGAAVAGIAMIAAAFIDVRAAAAGWLVGFTFWSQVLLGSLLLLMIHRLTGGRWGRLPGLAAPAAAIPLLFLLVIPVLVGIPVLHGWSASRGGLRPDVLALYLNTPLFVLRSVMALAGWSVLAVLMLWTGFGRRRLVAAVGLFLHCLVISSIAIDWYLSLAAPFTSSSFGASVAITQLIAAMAWTLVTGRGGETEAGDAGGLLLAFILGITYIDFMAVLVIWYGDLPREEIWFTTRERSLWPVVAWAAFLLTSVLPIFSLMLARVRNSRAALRLVAASTLIGLILYDAYLIAPPFGAEALIPAVLSLIGIGLLFGALTAQGIVLGTRSEARVSSVRSRAGAGVAGNRHAGCALGRRRRSAAACRVARRTEHDLRLRRAGEDDAGAGDIPSAAAEHGRARAEGSPARRTAASAFRLSLGRQAA